MIHPVLHSPPKPYTTTRIYLHWISALVILWATFSGFGVILLPVHHPVRQWVESFNPQITSLFIPLFAWRLWLYLSASSEPSASARDLQKTIARLTHTLIYLCVTGVLLTGVVMMNHPVLLLGIMPLPQLLHSVPALADVQQLHHLLCAMLAALVGLHLAAVVRHQLRGRSVLHRML
ncbi:cytochrome b/b6 domain-containing protein [Pseudomonas gingeri]|uniref:cytochrome b/b6 domain-containing protein n=1 Tax=Pseudomonas gingeri TaxID=117681 RepID=UPI0015A05FF8|nr:cytochrome b/b6 domain-containing protein [Pseudomonas gingeri]NWD67243.1 cytochrome b/b6 domain-containing protein [Pseudomonas gingeri]NWD77925.1 cytochrome b/b6 domain-containing protein [Pseudomonas gingeri]